MEIVNQQPYINDNSIVCLQRSYMFLKIYTLSFVTGTIRSVIYCISTCLGKLRSTGNTDVLTLIQRQLGGYLLPPGRVDVSVGIFSGSTSLECQGVVCECS